MQYILFLYSLGFFIVGLIVGSFLNCVLYRLEKEESLLGRSYCPNCKHTLSWVDLFPILSYVFLSGKCRYCKVKISANYPLIEFTTGFLFLFIAVFHLPQFQFSSLYFLLLVFYLYIISSFIVIFVFDLKYYIIPDKVLFPAIIITFLYQLATNYQSLIYNSLPSALGASLFFLAIFIISRGNWIGFGDVKLAVLLGLLLGFPDILAGLFLAFLFGAIIGLLLIIFSKKGLKSEVPFAPFLIFGTSLAMFFGQNIISWYVSLFVIL